MHVSPQWWEAARPAIIIPEGEVEISVAAARPDTELHHVPTTFFYYYFIFILADIFLTLYLRF